MEKRSIKRYRSNGNYRVKEKDNERNKSFYIKANISIGMVIIVMVGSYIDMDWSNKVLERLNTALTANTSMEDIESKVDMLKNTLYKNPREINAFAEDNIGEIELSEEIVEEINKKGNIYYENQKK